jgi:hypothetical protein
VMDRGSALSATTAGTNVTPPATPCARCRSEPSKHRADAPPPSPPPPAQTPPTRSAGDLPRSTGVAVQVRSVRSRRSWGAAISALEVGLMSTNFASGAAAYKAACAGGIRWTGQRRRPNDAGAT